MWITNETTELDISKELREVNEKRKLVFLDTNGKAVGMVTKTVGVSKIFDIIHSAVRFDDISYSISGRFISFHLYFRAFHIAHMLIPINDGILIDIVDND